MYVQPKTEFIYIPKYTDTSGYEKAIESAKRTISKLDNALDLAGAARDHCAALVDLKDNTIKLIAEDFDLSDEKIIEYQKKGLELLPEDIKKDLNPDSKTIKLLTN